MPASFTAERKSGTPTTNGSSVFTFSPASNCTAGATLILITGVGAVTSVTDTKGNTWAVDYINVVTAGRHSAVCSTPQDGGALTTGDTVTVTTDVASTQVAYWLEEFGGNYSAKDVSASGVGSNSTTLPTGTTAATANADEFAIAVYSTNQTSGTITKNANYTNFTTGTQTAVRQQHASYRILSATGTQNADATHTNMSNSNNGIVTYKAVAAAFVAAPIYVRDQAVNRAATY